MRCGCGFAAWTRRRRATAPSATPERAGGKAAAAFVERKIAEAEIVEVRNPQWGKWGGRVVADVLIDDESLAVALVQSLHGRWYGSGTRADCCSARGLCADRRDKLLKLLDTGAE